MKKKRGVVIVQNPNPRDKKSMKDTTIIISYSRRNTKLYPYKLRGKGKKKYLRAKTVNTFRIYLGLGKR